jgi:hypothetical protein
MSALIDATNPTAISAIIASSVIGIMTFSHF